MIKKMRGSIMLFIAAFIWGSAFVAQSEGMNYVGPFTYVFARSVIGTAVLAAAVLLFRLFSGKSVKEQSADVRASVKGGIFSGLVMFAATSFQQFGLTATSAGKAGFITSLYIIIVPLLGIFIRKKTPVRVLVCALAAVAGFYLLCIKENFTIEKGDFLMLICAVFFSVHILVTDHFTVKKINPLLMSCVQFLVVSVISGPAMLITENPDMDGVRNAAIPILYAGVLSSGVAFTLQIIAQKDTNPTVATLIMSLESVFAAVSGWLILGEIFSSRELSGCILVFSAVLIAQIPLETLINKKRIPESDN